MTLRSSALLLCVALVAGSSYPDKTSCWAEDPALDTLMKWVLPAVRTDAYTLRTADSCTPSTDPTSYVPGQFTSIHLRTHKYKGQFRGLLIYATDASNNRVGSWHLEWPNSNMFWLPGGQCLNRSLMHLNGAEKYYHHEFKFVGPPAGTGTIEFHTLIKRGQANTGEFYYANLAKNLMLAEGTAPSGTTWVQGAVQTSCTATCASLGGCDSGILGNAFKWAGALQKDVLRTVGCATPALTSDTATTISKDAGGWCTYPSPKVGAVTTACDAISPAGTSPLCPCGSSGLPSFGSVVPPPATDCLNNYVALGSASKSSHGLSFLMVLLTGFLLNHNKQTNLLLTLVCVLFCAYTVQAHNWVYSVSRSFNQASTYKPCRPRVNDVPHWQINAGQEFTMEWATGHDHYFYFTVIHADDILLLENTTQNDLDNYIKGCQGSDDYMVGKGARAGSHWAKQHINGDPKAKATAISSDANLPGEIYERNVSSGDPAYIPRHPKFGAYNNEVRWVYKDQFTNKDKRCSYFNANLPYIVAVHRFVQVETVMSRAGDRDTAAFTIEPSPNHQQKGQFLVQYLWRGYFDCADVDVFPSSVPVVDIGGRPLRADEPQWNKVDHCQFEEIQGLETSCSEVVTNANRCLKSCLDPNNQNCGGVNVVPMWLPRTVYPLFSDRVGIPWNDMSGRCPQSRFSGLSRGAYVCYGLSPRLPNNTHASYSVTDDPEDPLFYSTCFVKKSQWTFDLSLISSTNITIVTIPPAWAFGDKCVECNEWKASQENYNIPSWRLPENCVNCETATLPPVPALQGSLISRGNKCDGAWAGKTVWNYQTVKPECASRRCVKQLFLVGTNEIQADECIAKAKADPECSEWVQHRGNGNTFDGCECFVKHACCGSCVPVDVDFRNWEWNIYTTKEEVGDPTCAKGVKSPDNAYCCSANCSSCMPRPGLQVSFQDDAVVAPDDWAVDNGVRFGPRNNTGYTSSLSPTSYGWNCDLRQATEDRSSADGTNYHSTVVKPDSGICALGTVPPTWSVAVPNGFYQVDTLYTKPNQQMRGCKVQGLDNFDAPRTGLGQNDMAWVSRLVNTTDGKLSFTGGTGTNCGAYSAVVIYPKATGEPSTYCQKQPGMCCPLFVDMANRPCSTFDPPCKL